MLLQNLIRKYTQENDYKPLTKHSLLFFDGFTLVGLALECLETSFWFKLTGKKKARMNSVVVKFLLEILQTVFFPK